MNAKQMITAIVQAIGDGGWVLPKEVQGRWGLKEVTANGRIIFEYSFTVGYGEGAYEDSDIKKYSIFDLIGNPAAMRAAYGDETRCGSRINSCLMPSSEGCFEKNHKDTFGCYRKGNDKIYALIGQQALLTNYEQGYNAMIKYLHDNLPQGANNAI